MNNTSVGLADGPYRQSSSYDAWNNLLSTGGRFWSRSVTETASFDQFNRNPDWTYDAEGNVLSRNESFGDSLPSGHTYDAAGNMTKVTQTRPCWLEPQHLLQLRIHTNTQTHDGDGQVTRNEQAHKVGLNGTPTAVKTYYLRSSILGGRVISEYDGSDAIPTWTNTNVYAGGERLGQLSRQGASTPITSWRAADPVTGDEGNTFFDPNGVDVGLEDPFPAPGEEDETCVTYDPNYIDSHPRPFLNPFEGGANCVIDGIEQACNSVGSEAAVQCPDNTCRGYSIKLNQFVSFHAWADGGSGYLTIHESYLGSRKYYDSRSEYQGTFPQNRSSDLPQNAQNDSGVPLGGVSNLKKMIQGLSSDCIDAVDKLISKIASNTKREATHTNPVALFEAITSQTGGGGLYVDLSSTTLRDALPVDATRNRNLSVGGGSGLAWHFWSSSEKSFQRLGVIFLRPSGDRTPKGIGRAMASYLVTAIHEMTHIAAKDRMKYDHPDMDEAAIDLGAWNFDDYVEKNCLPSKYWSLPTNPKKK